MTPHEVYNIAITTVDVQTIREESTVE